LKALVAAGVLAVTAGGAGAATVNCPGTDDEEVAYREFSLTTTPGSTCFAYGSGNISGNSGGGSPDPLYALLGGSFGAGHVLIDKSDDAVSGLKPDALVGALTSGLSGAWSFLLPDAGAGFAWTNVILAFKSGNGQLDPDWAAFLVPDGVTSGDWAISGRQALSHVNLYAQKVPAAIPVPAAGFLLAGALGWLAALRRRRRPA
jgi:hypothetical protein